MTASRPTIGSVRVFASVALAAAAGIHFAVVAEHFRESPTHGLFFAVLAFAQAVAATLVLRKPSLHLFAAIGATHAGLVALWIVSRTSGLPGQGRETAGPADVVATLLAAGIAVAALVAARRGVASVAFKPALALLATLALTGTAAYAAVPADEHGHSRHVARGTGLDHSHSLKSPRGSDPGPDPYRRRNAPLDGIVVEVGDGPAAVAFGAGFVWVANRGDGTITRIDPTSHATSIVRVGGKPSGVLVRGTTIWVNDFENDVVLRFDAATGATIGRPVHVGVGPLGIASGPSGVWVTNSTDGTVTRIDPASGRPDAPIPVGFGPTSLAVTSSFVWVSNSLDRTVVRVNPVSRRVEGSALHVGGGAAGLVATDTSVWVASASEGTVTHIDTRTSTIVATTKVDRIAQPGQGPAGMAVGCGGVWVANNHDKTVLPADGMASPRFFGNVVSSYPTPQQIVCDGDALWVTNYDNDTVVRIT